MEWARTVGGWGGGGGRGVAAGARGGGMLVCASVLEVVVYNSGDGGVRRDGGRIQTRSAPPCLGEGT